MTDSGPDADSPIPNATGSPNPPAPDSPIASGTSRRNSVRLGSPHVGRLRPRTPAAWATVILGGTFIVLWTVFAVRAVDRNADLSPPPVTPPPATTTPDLRATVEAANRLLFPDRPSGSPAATPVTTPATPAASPAASPVTTP